MSENIILNEGQEAAMKKLIDFIKEGNHKDDAFCLSGLAGTGKTAILAKLVEKFPSRKFIVAAISHKAKENIYERISSRNVKPMTIAALVSMKMNPETGEFTTDKWADDMPIADADIVIIDEASMIDEPAHEYIMTKKLHRGVVIYAGDEGQIPPIRKGNLKKGLSPVFKLKDKALLTERVRQGEGNPILEDMDFYWNMTKNIAPNLTNLQRPDKENSIGGIYYRKSMKDVLDAALPKFRHALETEDTNHIKVITYTNKARIKVNEAIRRRLFHTETPDDFMIGDLMIMSDTYRQDMFKYENSLEFVITNVVEDFAPIDQYNFKYYRITGIASNGVVSIPVISSEYKERFENLVKRLFGEAAKTFGAERKNAFNKAWAVSAFFAKAEHAYAMSAHRSQGSSYDHVIVHLKDMLSPAVPIPDQERAALIYTAGTRARKTVTMVSSDFVEVTDDLDV